MKLSSLQLDFYTFLENSVIANHLIKERVEPTIDQFDCELRLSEVGDEPDKEFLIDLRLFTKDEFVEKSSYKVTLQAVTQVCFNKEPKDQDRREHILVVNAANLLYGAMRERLKTMTSSMIWGGITLPSVSFIGFKPEKEEKKDREK